MLATDELYEPLASDPTWHSTTFGGHPLSCAAGLAALNELELLAPRRAELEHALRERLGLLRSTFQEVLVEVRGCGLLWGIELASAGQAGEVLLELAQHGLLTSPCLSSSTTIRIAPPLTTTDEQLGQAMEILAAAIDGL